MHIFTKAMLKLTNSFYRYLTVNCQYSHFTHNRIKIPHFERNKTMSEEHPSTSHTSYGGSYDVSSDSSSSEDYKTSKQKPVQHDRPIPPNFRRWERVIRKSDTIKGNCFKFKVVSYNVLAQYLIAYHPYLYTRCTANNLRWDLRFSKIYEEIVILAPDIICLQEVELTHMNSYYSKFQEIGYTGVFKKKTGQRQDGCAIYFKESMFEMKEHLTVELNQPSLPLLNRDNVGIMLKLAPRCAPNNPIVVATTHLLYNPKRTDVRLAQIQLFLAEIDRFAYYKRDTESGFLPIILTGDFNSTPESAVTQLISNGSVSAKELRYDFDWKRIGVTDSCQHLAVILNRLSGQETTFSELKIHNSDYRVECPDDETENTQPPNLFKQLFNSDHVWHGLDLVSVYKHVGDGDYEATTFQDDWVTVDYIYYSRSSNLRVSDRLRLPTSIECIENIDSLPNEVFGSDHFALAVVFELTPLIDKATS